MKRMPINLRETQLKAIDSLVESGFFPNRSEAIRYAIDLLIRSMPNLQAVLKISNDFEYDGDPKEPTLISFKAPKILKELIRKFVKAGIYSNISEFMRDSVRLNLQKLLESIE